MFQDETTLQRKEKVVDAAFWNNVSLRRIKRRDKFKKRCRKD
jgi:hypothetical protein